MNKQQQSYNALVSEFIEVSAKHSDHPKVVDLILDNQVSIEVDKVISLGGFKTYTTIHKGSDVISTQDLQGLLYQIEYIVQGDGFKANLNNLTKSDGFIRYARKWGIYPYIDLLDKVDNDDIAMYDFLETDDSNDGYRVLTLTDVHALVRKYYLQN